jgi:electron transfer flavoprotein beta subunit
MAAKKKPVQTWGLADLDLTPEQVGLSAAWTTVDDVAARPPRQAGQVVADEGDGGERLVEYLAAAKLV